MSAMIYLNSLLLINWETYVPLRRTYQNLIAQTLHITTSNGRLDILVIRPPQLFCDAHHIVSELYAIADEMKAKQGRDEAEVRVLLEGVGGFSIGTAHDRSWEVVAIGKNDRKLLPVFVSENQSSVFSPALPIVILPGGSDASGSLSSAEESNDEDLETVISDLGDTGILADSDSEDHGRIEDEGLEAEYEIVALGGTFDHLHTGHKILLTMAGFLAHGSLVIGVTGDTLLQNKKYKEYLQPLTDRCAAVLEFVGYIFPGLHATTHEINDVYGQAVTIEAIEALVVSGETKAGAKMVNDERKRRGFAKLKVWVIGVVNGDASNGWAGKLSSTDLRKRDYERAQEAKKSQSGDS
ncbi:hypothetical protein V1512DRAFT_257431 [Lipomyces arxii]|uniref:uncharacterized protein n=1 Tax=Lipomyces arxii TaxID=56418 RepID=UPI0034CEE4D3